MPVTQNTIFSVLMNKSQRSVRSLMVLGTAFKVVTAIILSPYVAFGQDAVVMKERVERLERDISTLSRQVYRGGATSGTSPGGNYPPSAVAAAPASGYNEGLETRIDGLENTVRNLTGQVEKMRHDVDTQNKKLDRALGDIEFRFQQAAKAAPVSNLAAGGEPAVIEPQSPNNRTRSGVIDNVSPRQAAETEKPAPLTNGSAANNPPKILGTIPASPEPSNQGDVKPTGKTQMAVTLPDGGLQEQYDFAFGLLRNFEFDKAESAFKTFLQKNGDSKLAANAQYWLAETYYGRNDYKQSALSFAESYKKYPTGPKGPDSLLKLGMALGRLGQKAEACLSLDRLKQEYPSAAASVLQVADQEKKNLACAN